MARQDFPGGYGAWGELSQEMERLLESMIGRTVGSMLRATGGKFVPLCDLQETDQGFVVRFDLPGVDPSQVRVEVHEGKLTIAGKRVTFAEEDRPAFHRIERPYGEFYRIVQIPGDVEVGKIEAHYRQGVLEVYLPKTERQQAHRIEIRSGN
ncbi:MAG: heat-shock protein [Pirellulaceae bacterium]|nr:MAG: heat-shock protein [Pirellulaceae bacterium]